MAKNGSVLIVESNAADGFLIVRGAQWTKITQLKAKNIEFMIRATKSPCAASMELIILNIYGQIFAASGLLDSKFDMGAT